MNDEIEKITQHLINETNKYSVPMPNCFTKWYNDEHLLAFFFAGIPKAWENITVHKTLMNWEFTLSGYRGEGKNCISYKEILDAAAYFKKEGVLTTSRILNGQVIYKWNPLKLYT